jgi:hypothetical protein
MDSFLVDNIFQKGQYLVGTVSAGVGKFTEARSGNLCAVGKHKGSGRNTGRDVDAEARSDIDIFYKSANIYIVKYKMVVKVTLYRRLDNIRLKTKPSGHQFAPNCTINIFPDCLATFAAF